MAKESTVESDVMLDEPAFAVFYGILVLISDLLSLFFIFTIMTKSTADMKLFKFALLKLAICDLLLNFSTAILVTPDLLCPLSAVAVRSPIGGISEAHAFSTISLTIAIAITVFTSINDCCFLRVCIFYQWTHILKKIYSWRGALVFLTLNVVIVGILTLAVWFATSSNEEFLLVVSAENMTHALGKYASQSETVYFYVDIWKPKVVPLLLSVVVGLAAIYVSNLCGSRLVWKAIDRRKNNMSFKSYETHRHLTLLALFQNLIPAVVIAFPVFLVAFSFVMSYESDTFAELIKHFVTFVISIYPALSVMLSFIFIKPYRKYLFSLICSIPALRKKPSRVSDTQLSKKSSMGNEDYFDFVGYM
ncbi:G protein-coupled receptor [Caenorhabditis elegans]|uniref:G protein-coupled receptor n=1 Tax=Caenorhabditis elegans TaxID=6239 RepID=O16383_CAEEL|nr:G protein-coupled receptor [Caenorhabditis elegans]CCD70371.1 G protein-coupled receptor [Caenorhabditis elegans]|eukprot:NP_504607.1 Serpentine Receptor, class N [Caenorhabditis elegans]